MRLVRRYYSHDIEYLDEFNQELDKYIKTKVSKIRYLSSSNRISLIELGIEPSEASYFLKNVVPDLNEQKTKNIKKLLTMLENTIEKEVEKQEENTMNLEEEIKKQEENTMNLKEEIKKRESLLINIQNKVSSYVSLIFSRYRKIKKIYKSLDFLVAIYVIALAVYTGFFAKPNMLLLLILLILLFLLFVTRLYLKKESEYIKEKEKEVLPKMSKIKRYIVDIIKFYNVIKDKNLQDTQTVIKENDLNLIQELCRNIDYDRVHDELLRIRNELVKYMEKQPDIEVKEFAGMYYVKDLSKDKNR